MSVILFKDSSCMFFSATFFCCSFCTGWLTVQYAVIFKGRTYPLFSWVCIFATNRHGIQKRYYLELQHDGAPLRHRHEHPAAVVPRPVQPHPPALRPGQVAVAGVALSRASRLPPGAPVGGVELGNVKVWQVLVSLINVLCNFFF